MNTLRQQIKDVASYCNITPRMATVLQRFFLHLENEEEMKELDEWINERKEHDELFDLLCQVNKDGAGAGTMHMLVKLANKSVVQVSRRKKLVRYGIYAVIVLLLADHFHPLHPLTTLIYGSPDGSDFVAQTIETGDEPKTIWLRYDSTRIDLAPHSKIGFASELMYHRHVRLWGSATFHVRTSNDGPLRVKAGEGYWMEVWKGPLTILNDNGNLLVKRP